MPSAEVKTVQGWLSELDREIQKDEDRIRFFGNRLGMDSPSVQAWHKELNELRNTRKEYKKLLEEAKKKEL